MVLLRMPLNRIQRLLERQAVVVVGCGIERFDVSAHRLSCRSNRAILSNRSRSGLLSSTVDNDLIWNGERCNADVHPVIDTYKDHRMALAFAPACACFPGLRINDPSVVSKSYPRYWEDMRKAGYMIEEEP